MRRLLCVNQSRSRQRSGFRILLNQTRTHMLSLGGRRYGDAAVGLPLACSRLLPRRCWSEPNPALTLERKTSRRITVNYPTPWLPPQTTRLSFTQPYLPPCDKVKTAGFTVLHTSHGSRSLGLRNKEALFKQRKPEIREGHIGNSSDLIASPTQTRSPEAP